jgi:hypothetical protein
LIARSVLRHLTGGQAPTDNLSLWEQGAWQEERGHE